MDYLRIGLELQVEMCVRNELLVNLAGQESFIPNPYRTLSLSPNHHLHSSGRFPNPWPVQGYTGGSSRKENHTHLVLLESTILLVEAHC